MIEESVVTTAKDNGLKNRWGLGKFLYRQDGKKLTLNKKWVLGVTAIGFTLSTLLVLVKGPTQMELRSPIAFDGAVTGISTVEVPEAAVIRQKPAKTSSAKRIVKTYSGLEVIPRNLTLTIPPGTFGTATLVTGASNGPVKATLTEDLTINGEVLVPQGATLVGAGTSTEERLMIEFGKLVLRDGTVQTIRAQACDVSDQVIGLKGSKVSRYGAQLAAGIGLNFAGGMAQGLQETSVQGGVETKKNTFKNAALNGAATASIEQSKQIIEKWKNQKSIIEVKRGTEICILFPGE